MRIYLPLTLLALAFPAHACPMLRSLTPEDLAKADSTFIGTATAYQPETHQNRDYQPATLTFEVETVEKGRELPKTIEVYWGNSTFGMPESLAEFQKYYGPRTRLSIILPETYIKQSKCELKTYKNGAGEKSQHMDCESELPIPYGAALPPFNDKPWIIVGSCTSAAMEKAE